MASARQFWFERLGYRRIGELKTGIALKTQIMVRGELIDLAGKLRKAWNG